MSIAATDTVTLLLTPSGHLLLQPDVDGFAVAVGLQQDLVDAFDRGAGHGLLFLGTTQVGTVLPPIFAWWRDFSARYVTALCATAGEGDAVIAAPDDELLGNLIWDAPPMKGGEYLAPQVLRQLWGELDSALHFELTAFKGVLSDFLKTRHPAWNLVGRVYFNLAENRKDPEAPFAFLATYTSRLSAHGKAQHLPLSKALTEFSDGKSQAQLLTLLKPVQGAAQQCAWLQAMVHTGEIYHPLRWSPANAFQLLSDVPKLEAAGIVVRAPLSWGGSRPARPLVKASVGAQQPSLLGAAALLDFNMEVTLEGDVLTAAELKALLKGSDGLQLIRGRWVEVDRSKLKRMMARFEDIEKAAKESGLPFSEAMRLMAGATLDGDTEPMDPDWSQLVAGPWLAETLQGLRQPEGLAQVCAGADLKATLRPYQEAGVHWLYLLTRLGLGACLADDMGLGKTIQVLALLLILKREEAKNARPSLLVAPASLLANWALEAERFAPSLRVLIVHPSTMSGVEFRTIDTARLAGVDLVITSYGALLRLPVLMDSQWRLAVIDEAQAIKNPGAKQTRQVKLLKADTRIALTGTPVENRLADLWSIFDFTHPGLLGSDKVFANFAKRLAKQEHFGPLRRLVQPYILRRLKTDKRVINDLPDKTELKAWCHLSSKQAALYQRAVDDMAVALKDAQGIGRKGVVLSFLMRFKQICNHPSQWLGDSAWNAADSGKFARLRELVEVIAARQEKVLVFTQFRETTEPLAAFLGTIFGREGLVLHGGTPVAKRRELVKRFQEDELTPFFVLSLKAGGAGLNLTAASHVIHFDRWWNPAVENQATDRAFRIGQKKNVLVHKFVCQGTVEDRIDQLIESKQQLVKDVLEGGAELLLTEMSDRDLLDLVKLDIHTAQES
ncbi:MAG: DEAD/DEAH box helicase [Rhodoferax sp.]|uniref:DEAD/DEAH box helicase n=1 Tax=Rhodoferax sp. TaxID=50421 RepID=UPI001B6B57CD|nr:DEAD/DEAH box helicase [Rhodoferax sp.]MBP8286085.1 DEAD/DEAH box helicase [Rhodoferax sp.]MBP9737676.1 DEAD/DEAH box helicase [Rhodoferax sp.]